MIIKISSVIVELSYLLYCIIKKIVVKILVNIKNSDWIVVSFGGIMCKDINKMLFKN